MGFVQDFFNGLNAFGTKYNGLLMLIQTVLGGSVIGFLIWFFKKIRPSPKEINIHTGITGNQIQFHIRNSTDSNLHVLAADFFKYRLTSWFHNQIKFEPSAFQNRKKSKYELKFDNGAGHLSDLDTIIKTGEVKITILELDKGYYIKHEAELNKIIQSGNFGYVVLKVIWKEQNHSVKIKV